MAANPTANPGATAGIRPSVAARRARLVLLAGLAIQAVTGFGPSLIGGEVEEWPLLVHMIGAPLFMIGLTGLALFWTQRNVFLPSDGGLERLAKLLYWVVLLSGTGVALSMLIAMLPIFGHGDQSTLFEIHEYSALTMLIAAAVMVIAAWAARGVQR